MRGKTKRLLINVDVLEDDEVVDEQQPVSLSGCPIRTVRREARLSRGHRERTK